MFKHLERHKDFQAAQMRSNPTVNASEGEKSSPFRHKSQVLHQQLNFS